MMREGSKAVVVLSGGQDSTTCLGWALTQFETVACVSFDYGQRHRIELEAACKVVDFFKQRTGRMIEHEVVEIQGLLESSSPLTDPSAALDQYRDHETMVEAVGDRVEKTFVPMRNTLFLTIAANRAIAMGCRAIVTGVSGADSANYPDCTAEFINRLETAFEESIDGTFSIHTPLIDLQKSETVKLAIDTPHTYAALAYSHTAYNGAYPPLGNDHATVLRAHGFEQAGMPDPLILRAVNEGLMDMPFADNYSDWSRSQAQSIILPEL